jgi:anti-anti-sigma regulatory factor
MSCRNEAQVSEQPIGGINMLKITITETTAERRWTVQGRLVGPWVSELRTTWKKVHRSQDKRACIIDLNDVTFIDRSGERLLRAISKKGAQLVAKGLYVKHVLEQLQASGKRGLRLNVNREGSAMPIEVIEVISEANARNSSADRTARTEEK